MRIGFVFVVLLLVTAFLSVPAHAGGDNAPAYVVPGRPDVPVMINGYNAAWGVVEGDWGLSRPGFSPIVIPSPYAQPILPARHYYPSLGEIPLAGRVEIEPPANRRLPPTAESFHRSWSTSSEPLPATEYAPTPSVIMAPPDAYRRQNRRRH